MIPDRPKGFEADKTGLGSIGHGYTDQDFSTLLLLEAQASGMELKPENVEVGDGLSS